MGSVAASSAAHHEAGRPSVRSTSSQIRKMVAVLSRTNSKTTPSIEPHNRSPARQNIVQSGPGIFARSL